MIRGSAGCFEIDANGIVLADPVFQAFRKQRGLTAIHPSTKRLIRSSRKSQENLSRESKQAMRFYTGWLIRVAFAARLTSPSFGASWT